MCVPDHETFGYGVPTHGLYLKSPVAPEHGTARPPASGARGLSGERPIAVILPLWPGKRVRLYHRRHGHLPEKGDTGVPPVATDLGYDPLLAFLPPTC